MTTQPPSRRPLHVHSADAEPPVPEAAVAGRRTLPAEAVRAVTGPVVPSGPAPVPGAAAGGRRVLADPAQHPMAGRVG